MSALLSSFAASQAEEASLLMEAQSSLSFSPRPSLWSHIASLLQTSEHDEAQAMIGSALIADNASLHEEVKALIAIIATLQTAAASAASSTSSAASSSSVPSRRGPLPSLPLRLQSVSHRELLKEEVAYLIAAVREKAQQRADGDVSRVWTPRSERERSIVALLETERRSQSQRSSSSRCSTSRDSRPSSASRFSSSLSQRVSSSDSPSRPASSSVSSLPATVASLPALSISTLESVLSRLRAGLREEREALLADVDYLRSQLEEQEAEQEERRRLQQEAQSIAAPTEAELRQLAQELTAAIRQEDDRQHTAQLLASVQPRPAFMPDSIAAAGALSSSPSASSPSPLPPSSAADSVDSLLTSLEDLEAALYQPRPGAGASSASKDESEQQQQQQQQQQHDLTAAQPAKDVLPAQSALRPAAASSLQPLSAVNGQPAARSASTVTSAASSSSVASGSRPRPAVTAGTARRRETAVLLQPMTARS